MTNKDKKPNIPQQKPNKGGWKAVNPVQFSESYSSDVPHYEEFSSGKVVIDVNEKDVNVIDWINNKIIVKE